MSDTHRPEQDNDIRLGTPRPMRRRQSGDADQPPNDDAEEWMMTYMDTVTLLVVLFVLLLSMATFDDPRVREIQAGLKGTAGPHEASESGSTIAGLFLNAPPSPRELGREITARVLPDGVRVTTLDDRVRIEIDSSVLFAVGNANLSASGERVLTHLVPVLQRGRFGVSVEGHTDDVPIANAQFPSNWELSSARASVVVRHFITSGIGSDRLRAIGYADTRPIDPEKTAAARNRNRRVELVLELSGQDQAVTGPNR